MPASTQTRPAPVKADRTDFRLPWWGVALPVVAFVTLLLLVLNPTQAAAAGDTAWAHLLARVLDLVPFG